MKANKLKELIQNLQGGYYTLTNQQINIDELAKLDDKNIRWIIAYCIDKYVFVRKANCTDNIMLVYEVNNKLGYAQIMINTNENIDYIRVNYYFERY